MAAAGRRVTARHIIGRIYVVRPALTAEYALRLLLCNVGGACSFEDLRTVAGASSILPFTRPPLRVAL